jgi:aminoglycoside 6'-N-acetyltransferase I
MIRQLVDRDFQGRGIGRALVEAAESYARAAGHDEMASDSDLENADGIAAHLALGYQEVERFVTFRKSLRDRVARS